MATKRPDDTASPSGLELLEARQELPPAPAGNDDEPRGIDEVSSAVHGRVHADLAVCGNDVEPVDDDAPQPRALAHRGVVHDDRVLDDGALVDPHGAAEGRSAATRRAGPCGPPSMTAGCPRRASNPAPRTASRRGPRCPGSRSRTRDRRVPARG